MADKCIETVDLFCGAGGLSYGLGQANINIIAGIDIDSTCKFPYEENTGAEFIEGDIGTLKGSDIDALYSKGAIRLLAGCAPCQPFSTLANSMKSHDHKKWSMLEHFARLVREVEPELITMENVPRVIKHSPYQEFISTLTDLGYNVDAKCVRCTDLGIPQDRRRFVLVASKLGKIEFDVPKKEDVPVATVRDAIAHLPKLGAGECDPNDALHKSRDLAAINLKRIKASKPGGTWEDWPVSLRAECHKRETGSSYKSVYSRMEWDKPSPTITTQCFSFGTGRFGHPEQDRAITLREAAILQSFPENYTFIQSDKGAILQSLGRLIGNAVPPKLGEAVGECLTSHIANASPN